MVEREEASPQAHRSHDVPHLLKRWRAVARSARMRLSLIHETEGHPVYFLTTQKVSRKPLYLSAGVHGDEAAAVLGLLEWAESSLAELRDADVILVPLFNPAGLARNNREDAHGTDLNRCFDHHDHPHLAGWHRAMSGYAPRLAGCLHEDYDAWGIYAYELNRADGIGVAEPCLAAAEQVLPRDPRATIEGRRAHRAIIRPRKIPMKLDLPEAVALYRAGTPCTVTFETPSEFSLARRTAAHVQFLRTFCSGSVNQLG